ncbi:MAG: DUF4349 domain-containing protein [Deltaproteobacteria bacterium]|nr:DUF4349 domain-containing protein [Deltaproteobacteria bacterium]
MRCMSTLCMGLVLLLAAPGCAAGKAYSPVPAQAPAGGPIGKGRSFVSQAAHGQPGPAGGHDGEQAPARAREWSGAAPGPVERKVVYTGSFTVDVYEIKKAQAELLDLVKGLGGYMQETRGHVMVVRVPAEKFESIEAELRKLGRVDDSLTRIQAADITARYVDAELRLKTKRRYLDTLTRMLEQAGSLKDKLEVQKEIARVVEEIEALEGQLRLMQQQVALATVTVAFRLAHSGTRRTFRLPWDWLDALGLEQLIP